MTVWGRLLLSLLVLTTCLAGFSYTQPGWLSELGLELEVAPEDAASPEDLALLARLDHKTEVIVRRLAAKRDVTRQVIDGGLTLLEAAALFRQLNATPADCPCSHDMMPGSSDGEKLCRQVIGWVEQQMREATSASQAAALKARFEAELEELLDKDGTVRLPEE